MSPRRFLGVLETAGLLHRVKADVSSLCVKALVYFTHEGKSSGSESRGPSEGNSTRLRGVFAGDELGKAIGDELPAVKKGQGILKASKRRYLPANKGVLFGVLRPTALLAVIPRSGVLSGAFDPHRRAGVPDTEGVPARKRGC